MSMMVCGSAQLCKSRKYCHCSTPHHDGILTDHACKDTYCWAWTHKLPCVPVEEPVPVIDTPLEPMEGKFTLYAAEVHIESLERQLSVVKSRLSALEGVAAKHMKYHPSGGGHE